MSAAFELFKNEFLLKYFQVKKVVCHFTIVEKLSSLNVSLWHKNRKILDCVISFLSLKKIFKQVLSIFALINNIYFIILSMIEIQMQIILLLIFVLI